MRFLIDILIMIFALFLSSFFTSVENIFLYAFCMYGIYKLIDSFIENLIRGE